MPNKLTKLTINRADLVDLPSNPLARVMLFKRDVTKNLFGAKTTDGVLAREVFWDTYYKLLDAFRTSVDSILYDGEVDDKKRVTMLKESVTEVSDRLKELFDSYPIEKSNNENDEIYLTVEKTVDVLQELDTLLTSGEISVEEVADILGGLDMPEDKTKKAETVEKTEFDAKVAELTTAQAEIVKLKADVTGLTKAAEDVAKAKVTPTEPEDIWKNVNPAVKAEFEALKKQSAENEKIAKAAEENAAVARIAKRVEQDFGGITGTVDEKTALLREIEKTLAAAQFEKLCVALKTASEAIKKSELLTEKGSTGTPGAGSTAFEKIKVRAAELMKAGTAKTEAEAIAKVATDNPSLYKEYIEEGVN